jgi:DNA-binding transcriptional MerR regulator/methylmalonyl-CoA mutase cobalamin-binding subunit
MHQATHTIKVAAKMTGLSPHVIRIWERRYGAVVPKRTATQRRRYTAAELQRLSLLRQATEMGHAIGAIARLTSPELTSLVESTRAESAKIELGFPILSPGPTNGEHENLDGLFTLIKQMDSQGLEDRLSQYAMKLGMQGLLCKVIAPLLAHIGDEWQKGNLTAAHEHFGSAVVRDFLQQTNKQYSPEANAPLLLVCTPAGQIHELGATLVAAMAAQQGWRVTYLGASLPAFDIAGAATQTQARAIALSIVHPADDPNLATELTTLRRLLPSEVKVIVGGRAMEGYRPTLHKIGALQIEDLDELNQKLVALRSGINRVDTTTTTLGV